MTDIAELKPCPTCGRVWVCMTGTAAQISGMILCPKCYGRTGQIDLDCPVCGGNGLDPESFRGCCECGEENDPEEEQL